MGCLQDALNRMIKDQLAHDEVARQVLQRALHRRGTTISKEQLNAIVRRLICTTDSGAPPSSRDASFDELELTDEELQTSFDEYECDVMGRIERAVSKSLETGAPLVLASLKKSAASELAERRRVQREFEERLVARWQPGLDRLEMLVIIAMEAGEEFASEGSTLAADTDPNENVACHSALTVLHVRACRVASEVLALLKTGYADGAHARWRALHEVAVIASFVATSTGDLALRFLSHSAVDRLRGARQYQQHHTTLGYEAIPPEELDALERQYEAVVARFGPEFKNQYGWAAKALGSPNPTFADIERRVDLDKWRPFYRMACHSVHAGAHGVQFSLGIPAASEHRFLAGASNAGLCDPGHSTAISLTLATVSFLNLDPNLDRLVVCQVMRLLTDEIGQALLKTHAEVEAESEQRARAASC